MADAPKTRDSASSAANHAPGADGGQQKPTADTGKNGAKSPLPAGLYIVATPIGNLGDITARALETLKNADAVACEDTRVTGHLLRHFGIRTVLIRYDDHAGARARPEILARLAQGQAVALVSDAGTPLLSDPGFKLVDAALAEGHRVIPVPGASALLAALAAAGLPTDRFYFGGFLPVKQKARRDVFASLADLPATLAFYESPKRLAACLKDAQETLGPRQAVIGRELTKLYEEFTRGRLDTLAPQYADRPAPKGEAVLMIGPPEGDAAPDESTIDTALLAALATQSVKDAAAEVAKRLGLPRKEVYRRALALKDAPEKDPDDDPDDDPEKDPKEDPKKDPKEDREDVRDG